MRAALSDECDGLELRQLRYVLALSEARSFRRAARVLAIPAGVLSREIAATERRIGSRLFERHPRGAVPTAGCVEIAEVARRLLGQQAAANREAAVGAATLDVGHFDYGPGREILWAALAEFQAQFPHVAVQLAPRLLVGQQAPSVADGALGVGFSFGPPPPSRGVRTEVLLHESSASAMLPADHRLAACSVVSLRELSSTPIHTVRMETAPEVVSATLDGLARGGWRGRLTPGSTFPAQVMARIARGVAWAPCPSSLHGWTPPGTVVIPIAEGSLADFEVHVVWRDADALAAAFVRIVIDIRNVIEAAGDTRRDAPDVKGRSTYHGFLGPRNAERARIARDLHDTVLQDVLGTQLQLKALHTRLPPELAHEREVVRQAVERLGRVGRDARDTVERMRPAESSPREIALALASTADRLCEESPTVEFDIRVEGIPRALCAGVDEAASRIAIEALTNAFRHASARLVSVIVEYWDDQFRVCISDDGAGIPRAVLDAGRRAGHFGLATMRERAEEIGATLRIRSGSDVGTRVELTVPGHTAFVVLGC